MKKADTVWAVGLCLAALWIWLRDLGWTTSASDTLPILAGFLLIYWLQRAEPPPTERMAPPLGGCVAAGALGLLGVVLDSTTVLALAWAAAFGSWLATRVRRERRSAVAKLLVLAFLAFPWMATDFSGLGWYFRLSGAAATQSVLAAAGLPVLRQGTSLSVNGFALSVEAACSGLNGLQAMLIAGAAVAFVKLERSRRFWPALAVLPLAAWLANFLRILFAAIFVAELPRAEAVRWVGPAHLMAGGVAIALMFALCCALFGALARGRSAAEGRRRFRLRLLEPLLLGYAAWQSREIVASWRHAPFEQLGWLAFAIWLCPVLLRGGWRIQVPGLAAAGLAAVAAGQLGDLNALCQVGLAALLASTAPCRQRWLWMLTAIAWLSPLGWLGSRTELPPAALAAMRILIACAGAATEAYRPKPLPVPLTALAYDPVD